MHINRDDLVGRDHFIACPSCDHLADLSSMAEGDRASCSHCGHLLCVLHRAGLNRVMAWSSSALIFLLLACSFPFLSFESSGLKNVMTLPMTVVRLYQQDMPDLAILIAGFIILIPAMVLLLLFNLATTLAYGRYNPWTNVMCRFVFQLQGWSMVEVFFIGVLISLVKLGKTATIVTGLSFWAYAAFSICFILAITGFDRLQAWRRIGELQEAG
ncbi:MAG: hypothetical protein GY763_11425 [Gammaproteobacteria bacterium]|nr:hypothetical protein [Gammaproteobacteria bacterium]